MNVIIVVIEIEFPVNKIFLEQPPPEPKVKVLIPMYKPLEVATVAIRFGQVDP